jgi:hypothetical protein
MIKDLDLSSYWFYLMNQLSSYFFYNIKNDFKIIKPIVLDENYNYLSKNKNINLNNFYLLSKMGFVVFMKDKDKKKLSKKKNDSV